MRTLKLKKETLVELTYGELTAVVGASFPSKYNCTESYQVCNPLSDNACVASLRTCLPTVGTPCIPTQTC
jgi:hypothetical protein